ncbi:MAG: hypothetical protein AAGA27_04785 [Pseudomonadota bacterium]
MNLLAFHRFLKTQITPQAYGISQSTPDLKKAFHKMMAQKFCGLHVKKAQGGLNCSTAKIFFFWELLACSSYDLAFLSVQQEGVLRQLAQQFDSDKTEQTINAILSQQQFIGHAIAHLLKNTSQLHCELRHGDYYINGKLDWLTGYQIFDRFMLGFKYQEAINYCILPFVSNPPTLEISPPLALGTVPSSSTVSLRFNDYRIKGRDVMRATMKGKSVPSSLGVMVHISLSLGVARNGLMIIRSIAKHVDHPFYKKSLALWQKHRALRRQLLSTTLTEIEVSTLRITALRHAHDILLCATLLSKGRVALQGSPVSLLGKWLMQTTVACYRDQHVKTLAEFDF